MSVAHHMEPEIALPFEGGGVALVDRAHLARCGAKGSGTRAWLEAQGHGPAPAPNRAARLAGDALLVMLGENDALILGAAPWAFGDGDALAPRVYPMPRREGTAWLHLSGAQASAVLACVCGVDLRPRAFGDLEVAQTILARVSAIVIREDRAGLAGYHILADISYRAYLAAQLVDAARSLAQLEGRGT